MTRDYSQFLPDSKPLSAVQATTLQRLGWRPFFAQQTSADELELTPPARVVSIHRSGPVVIGDKIEKALPAGFAAAVGDWVLINPDRPSSSRILDRSSLIKRRAPGPERAEQMIAANIDTAFIVTSCNADFNVARLERYISLAFEARVAPVILLTKTDLTEDTGYYLAQAQSIATNVPALALNAKAAGLASHLADWTKPGQTIAFMGSSGVGKSTLTNAILGEDQIATNTIRESDAKGRHTTTSRELRLAPGGCLVLDTPGMRELGLTDAAAGVAELFHDFTDLAMACKFRDCAHETEPGCAINAAIQAEEIDANRVARWRKLMAEDAHNSATLAERRARDKAFGKMVRNITKSSQR
jgi:ribosome biogenesis GTPase